MLRVAVRLLPLLVPILAAVPAEKYWMLSWSGHKMTVLDSVPASSRIECGVRCARRQGCAATAFNTTNAPLSCLLLACEPGWVASDGNCYAMFQPPSTWTVSRDSCVANWKGHLVSVHSEIENLFVDQMADGYGVTRFQLGLFSDGTGWQWSDGTPVDYTNWSAGEGSDQANATTPKSASLLSAQGSAWADNSVSDFYYFMCKRAKVFPP